MLVFLGSERWGGPSRAGEDNLHSSGRSAVVVIVHVTCETSIEWLATDLRIDAVLQVTCSNVHEMPRRRIPIVKPPSTANQQGKMLESVTRLRENSELLQSHL